MPSASMRPEPSCVALLVLAGWPGWLALASAMRCDMQCAS
jgi:hypothetical protein